MSNFFHRLLEQPEGKTIEFKRDLSSSKPIMKALVAFANTAGGRLIIGVSDDRQVRIETALKGVEAQVEAQVVAQVDLQILAACALNRLSSAEIAAALGHKQLSGNLRKALPRLRDAQLLEYTIPEKPKSRLQKYRLTAKGQGWVTTDDSAKG